MTPPKYKKTDALEIYRIACLPGILQLDGGGGGGGEEGAGEDGFAVAHERNVGNEAGH